MNPCKKKDSLNFNTIYLRGVISRYFWEIFVSKKELGVIYELSTRQQPVFFCSWANGSFFVLDIFIVRNPKFPPKNKTKEPNLGSLVDRGPNSTSPKSQELTLKSPIFVSHECLMKYLLECHIFPELHPDLFSRHASPLEVDVMSAVVNIFMSDEICRRFNGNQQQRRRSGQSVQLTNWFMIRHSSSRHVCTYTYVLRTTKHTQRKQKAPPPR